MTENQKRFATLDENTELMFAFMEKQIQDLGPDWAKKMELVGNETKEKLFALCVEHYDHQQEQAAAAIYVTANLLAQSIAEAALMACQATSGISDAQKMAYGLSDAFGPRLVQWTQRCIERAGQDLGLENYLTPEVNAKLDAACEALPEENIHGKIFKRVRSGSSG